MSRKTIMFAVPSPTDIGLIEADKLFGIAAALDAQLQLFHCVFDANVAHPGRLAPASAEEPIQQLVSNAQRGLERIAERFRARGVQVETSVRWDDPAHEGVVRQVLRHEPSLLIARSHHHERTAGFAEHTERKLIETCPCPLLLLKSPSPYAKPLVIAAVDPTHAHDGPADLDEQVLDSAALLTAALSGTLEVFHARLPWEEAIHQDPSLRDLPEYRDEEIHRAYLARMEARVLTLTDRHNIGRAKVTIEDGHAAGLLPRFAKERNASIVAIAAMSRSRLRRALLGDTAERMLDALDADVLIVKPPGFRTPVRRQSTHHVVAGPELRSRLRP